MRNYVEFFSGRINQSGNYVSFIRGTRADCENAVNAYQQAFGGTIDWSGKKGYFLMNRANVIGLLQNWTTHYVEALGSSWNFFQDGGVAQKSPRKVWSHGE